MDPIDRISAPFQGLLDNLSPKGRRALARDIARQLRASNTKRIASQQNPDGTPFAPRKTQARRRRGSIRRTMFSKMRTARFLKIEATPESAAVVISGRAARIAQVHQFGLRDRVNAKRGLIVQYARRELLGFTEQDKRIVADTTLNHLAK
ncbi:phage virion morphogenesis protein [Methylobacillus glycogenes]|uniref:phage virion morphogenesis protein n=1 Tax=Methylobacillus glycogenes TaxID=406 RepID=UPI0004714839|nr:phage virion morphogenesis protein [Methylobacillus glycogenes]